MNDSMNTDPFRPPKIDPVTDLQSVRTLDRWIETLMNCKQLSEDDVKRLCEQVDLSYLVYTISTKTAFH